MSKQEMTPEQREQKEQEEFQTGPLRVLTDSVKNNTQVLINCRYYHTTPQPRREGIFDDYFVFQEQQKAFGSCEGLRQALQHGPGGSQRDVDRAAQEWER